MQHWRIVNPTREVHPFHIHQVHFLSYAQSEFGKIRRDGWTRSMFHTAVRWASSWTSRTRSLKEMSLFHCHLLSHEDKGMMAKILFQ